MTDKIKQRLIDLGREDVIWVWELEQVGQLGMDDRGNYVDMRDNPDATPIKEIRRPSPEPRPKPKKKVA